LKPTVATLQESRDFAVQMNIENRGDLRAKDIADTQ
jgi:hypothetical protein